MTHRTGEESVNEEIDDTPTFVIVNPLGQYFAGTKTLWSITLDGEYEPCGSQTIWSDRHEDAIVYWSRRSAERASRRRAARFGFEFIMNGATLADCTCAVVGPS